MKLLNLFRKDERGGTAIIFGLSLLPVMGLAGAAIDYSRASSVQASLQKGVDGAALQLAQKSRSATVAELQTRGQQLVSVIAGNTANLEIADIRVEREEDEVRVIADAIVTNAFMGLFGITTSFVSAEGSATSGNKTIELALVLDNTGSMDFRNRMTELKAASRNLLQTLNNAVSDDDTVRVSIVPFDARVRVDASANRYAGWMRFNSPVEQARWRGFIDDRDQPYHTDASAADRIRPETLYPASSVRENLATILPLTSVRSGYTALRNKIDSMRPNGCTNITIGTVWGLASLTPGGPLPGARPVGTDGLEKIMILLTDGDNTRSRYHRDSDCKGSMSRFIDPSTRSACDSAKNAGVTVYTVRLTAGNAALLRNCASRAADGRPLYYDVVDASQLDGVFQEIVNRILATRLTQ